MVELHHVEALWERAVAELPLLGRALSSSQFGAALERSLESRFRGHTPTPFEATEYLDSLQLAELGLACACAEGDEAAWEHFVAEYRAPMRTAARSLTRDDVAGDELADSMLASLYGADAVDAARDRKSLFAYFHGRSRLTTWLRAVMAQRHVDALRRRRRQAAVDVPDLPSHDPDPERHRYVELLRGAVTEALEQLEPRARLRLACYYVQEMTLAQIGRLVGEHESTVSRQLAATRRELRETVARSLSADQRLTEAEVRQCYAYAIEEFPYDLSRALGSKE